MGRTLHYRIWAYARESESKNVDIGATANSAKPKLVIDTDANYPRMVGDGFVAQGQEYTHNLGYRPIVKAWHLAKNASVWSPTQYGEQITADCYNPIGNPYFGYPSTIDSGKPFIVQTTKSKIITYASSQSQQGDGTYFRMYLI